ncbi:solute carrier family protein [Sarocladium implicatum]|nr:solute carrier family protein [Sarocladium implicatum]
MATTHQDTKDTGSPTMEPVTDTPSQDQHLSSSPSTDNDAVQQGLRILEARSVHWWDYFTTRDFWLVCGLGQVLALCITSTNTFTSLLDQRQGFNIPALQTMFNYVALLIVYNSVFLYLEGFKGWWATVKTHGWKYIIMAFLDVLGNYFTVLAYGYTNILSAQLINFWAIAVVVIVSFFVLKVRYKIPQVIGIVVAIGGMGILIASDHLSGTNGGKDSVKGDMFALAGATCYGLSNTFEEWLVSKAPMYHVLGFIGFFGLIINGVVAAIFDRDDFVSANWNGDVAGYLVGFTVFMFMFYSLIPLMLRMGSASFMNISLLTGNFWGVIIGTQVFGYPIHYLYPVAFVCIILGLVCYFLSGSLLGDSKKPWLGENQEDGVVGVGTAKRKAIHAARRAQGEPENGTSQQ